VGAASTFDKVVSFVKNPIFLLVLGGIVILVGLLLTRRGRGSSEPKAVTPRTSENGSRRQAPRQRTPEERRRMHEERMRRRRERAEREEGTG
jgi:hypothetical protein